MTTGVSIVVAFIRTLSIRGGGNESHRFEFRRPVIHALTRHCTGFALLRPLPPPDRANAAHL